MAKNLSYRHILKYTGVFGGIQVISVLASVLRNKAAALLIDRYGQGISDLFNSTVNLINSATTLIVPVAIVRRISFLYEKFGMSSISVVHSIRVMRSWSILTGLIGSLLVMLCSPLLSRATCDTNTFAKSYFLLSPMLLMLSVNGTEIAILKATRQLKQLATASIVGSIATLVICVVCYYLWSIGGVVVSLNVSLFVVTLLNVRYTTRYFPYKVSPFLGRVLVQGKSLIKLGISFLLASLAAALSETLIRTYISHSGSIENVGLYAAGFALTVTYTRFIFNAMDADYYPHLSGICNDKTLMNNAINKQISICVQLIVPCLLMFALLSPIIIKLLYTEKYLEIVPMIIFATPYMFCKAIVTPIAYTALAKSDSGMYLTVEIISAVVLGVCVIVGYELYDLTGCGIGLSVSNAIETAMITTIYHKRYGVIIHKQTTLVVLLQLALFAIGTSYIAFCNNPIVKVIVVFAAIVFSVSIFIFSINKNKSAK